MPYIKTMILLFTLLLTVSTPGLSAPVDLNTADAEQLANAIDGVGERKARAIVQYRDTHGPFTSVDQLADVKGIGPSTVNKNRHDLTINSSSTSP